MYWFVRHARRDSGREKSLDDGEFAEKQVNSGENIEGVVYDSFTTSGAAEHCKATAGQEGTVVSESDTIFAEDENSMYGRICREQRLNVCERSSKAQIHGLGAHRGERYGWAEIHPDHIPAYDSVPSLLHSSPQGSQRALS